MTATSRSLAIFTAASLLTLSGWLAFWPAAPQPAVTPSATKVEPVKEWNRQELQVLIDHLKAAAGSERERLDIVAELARIPISEIPAALASIPLEENHQLTLGARVLLIRWASADGEAAIDWSWANLKEKAGWRDAVVQVCEAWAWSDPASLERWALAYMGGSKLKDATLEEVRAAETPILSFGNITRIAKALLREDPRGAFAVFLKRGGFSTGDDFMWNSLTDPLQIEKALTAFEDLEPMKAGHDSMTFRLGPMTYAESLMKRWMEIDPEGFSKSRYPAYLHPRFKEARQTAGLLQDAAVEMRAETASERIEAAKPEYRPGAVREIAVEWGKRDPLACRAWAESLPLEQREQAAAGAIVVGTPAELTATLDWLERFAGGQRQQCFVSAYDSWIRTHPGREPDMTGWSSQCHQAWLDLDALRDVAKP